MSLTIQIAKQFREIYYGKWVTGTNLKAELSDLTWQQATTKISDLNTIAGLVFHINYYVAGLVQVLKGGTLDIQDKYSFDLPPIESSDDWDMLRNQMWSDAEDFATLVEQMPEEKLKEAFVKEEYGDYRRNLMVIINHSYYHLGQIVIIKKLLQAEILTPSQKP